MPSIAKDIRINMVQSSKDSNVQESLMNLKITNAVVHRMTTIAVI